MRQFHLFTAAAALALATPLMAQGRDHDWDNRVPLGQRPPAGMCRVWIEGVPPGRQPAPTSCAVAARRLPPNAHLIYGPTVYNNGYYNNDRLYQEQILRDREIQIARERELQIARERELQIARDREFQIARERELRAREIEAERVRSAEIRDHEIRDQQIRDRQIRDHDGDRNRDAHQSNRQESRDPYHRP